MYNRLYEPTHAHPTPCLQNRIKPSTNKIKITIESFADEAGAGAEVSQREEKRASCRRVLPVAALPRSRTQDEERQGRHEEQAAAAATSAS